MESKKKKQIVAVSGAIISALRKAHNFINENGHLPEVEDYELPRLAPAIMKTLEKEFSEIQENERFEGLSYEEVTELKEAERKEQLAVLQNQAGELLKSLKKPEIIEEDPEVEVNDLDTDDLDEDPDDGDGDLDADELDEDPEELELFPVVPPNEPLPQI
ncbi:hypothetical protein [Dyadobacter sp. LHD-138]|uniref:hypothetical protein n=1 Tax=Dyadobacter sp. LHD-138 TaxID=3071413 RepID=UPI0027DFC01C|nr:hypothetical protein [Dyadobacter sp. LHD-138]MDQ6479806.1 hypothetical protein [Dyadobacter sp. LHD-138]